MSPRRQRALKPPSPPKLPSNYVAEWFGHAVFPVVDSSDAALDHQRRKICPFLTVALDRETTCAKKKQTGFCTAYSNSNGPKNKYQNWLACPFRVLDKGLPILTAAVRQLFGVGALQGVELIPVLSLNDKASQQLIRDAHADPDRRVFVFSQTEFGGEVDVPDTEASPGVKIDASVFEVVGEVDGLYQFGQSMIFEIQTADFHGSPMHAINALRGALGNDAATFHDEVKAHPEWVARKVQGPNKSNIFKRTIYQTVLKIQLARDPLCAGFVITIPEAVWDSWRTHLGLPDLEREGEVFRLRAPNPDGNAGDTVEPDPAWIYVFDIDEDSPTSPRPLRITREIRTTSADLLHFTFEAAPREALARNAMDAYRTAFEKRVKTAQAGKLTSQKALAAGGTLPAPGSPGSE